MTSSSNKSLNWLDTHKDKVYQLQPLEPWKHGMTYIMKLRFSYIITNLKSHSDACWDFQPNHYKSACGVAKDYTPIKLKKQMGESQLSNTTMLN